MKIKSIGEALKFDNGMVMETYHETECSEADWADFSVLAMYNVSTVTGEEINIFQVEFDEDIKNSIVLVPDMGFKLVAKNGDKFFIPCYSDNNGCYSADLTLVVSKPDGTTEEIDISKCQTRLCEELRYNVDEDEFEEALEKYGLKREDYEVNDRDVSNGYGLLQLSRYPLPEDFIIEYGNCISMYKVTKYSSLSEGFIRKLLNDDEEELKQSCYQYNSMWDYIFNITVYQKDNLSKEFREELLQKLRKKGVALV